MLKFVGNEQLSIKSSPEVKIRPGSKAHIESLKAHLDEILDWEAKIKEAKGKEAQDLRKEFKDKFGTTFNVKLMERLTGESRFLEKKNEKPEAVIEMKVAEMQDMVAEDIEEEKKEAIQKGIEENSEFNEEASKIDIKRDELVQNSVNKAEELVKKDKNEQSKKEDIENINKDEEAALRAEILATEGSVLTEIKSNWDKERAAAGINEETEREHEIIGTRPDTSVTESEKAVNVETSIDETIETGIESQEKYPREVLETFGALSLSGEDLDTVPGFEKLPIIAQLMVAESLQSMSLETAKKKAEQTKAKTMQGKSWVGRFGQSIKNSFKSKAINNRAINEQIEGGLEEHGVNLLKLTNWAETFIPEEQINEAGESNINFVSSNFKDYAETEEEKVAFSNFNIAATALASLPKHHLVKFDSVSRNSPEHKKAQEYWARQKLYDEQKASVANILMEKGAMGPKEAVMFLGKADAKVNMIQFLAANPELEQEWSQMIKGDSAFKKIVKYVKEKDNWKFFAGGMAGRQGVSMAFASTFGTAAGLAAIPLVAATIGSIRGRERAKKQLKEKDKFIDKKDLVNNPILTQRQEALAKLREQQVGFIEFKDLADEQLAILKSKNPKLSEYSPEQMRSWNMKLSFEQMQELKLLNPEQAKDYEKAKNTFDQLNQKWEKIENKNIEKKTLGAQDLTSKLDRLINKNIFTSDVEERNNFFGEIQRRLDWTKSLADNGLVNFGKVEERTDNMFKFYEVLNKAQVKLYNFDYENIDLNYETGKDDNRVVVEMKERAEDLISYFEYSSDKKLDKKRKKFITRKMIQGALTGAALSSAGAGLFRFDEISDGATKVFSAVTESSSAGIVGAVPVSAGEEVTKDIISNINAEETSPIVDISAGESLDEANTASTVSAGETPVDPSNNEVPVAPKQSESLFDLISNTDLSSGQHDSVWRSTKEIFLNNANSLGYEGDEAGLSKWAEIQTNKALASSGGISDKVFEGNRVILEKSGDDFFVSIEQGDGLKPDKLPEINQTEILSGTSDLGSGTVNLSETITNAKSLEVSQVAINRWLDMIGEKIGLESSEMFYSGNNVVKTIIGGHDIFIDPTSNQYFLFDGSGAEMSGFLADDSGNVVSDVKSFFADKLGLEDIGTLDEGSVANEEPLDETFWSEDISSGPADVEEIIPSQESEVVNDKSWEDLKPKEQLHKINQFLSENTEGMGLRSKANDIGLFISMNINAPTEELNLAVLHKFATLTDIENLTENITDKEQKELTKLISFISKNSYIPKLHSQKLARLAVQMMVDRGSLSL